LMIGLGIGIGIGRAASSAFNISSIFAAHEKVTWLEPWDLTTMFQDSAGTIPVTDYGQAVGLRLDKSKGLVLGPELVTNGTFDADSGWTKGVGWSISGGVAASDGSNTAASYLSAITPPSLTAGKSYEVSFTYSVSAGRIRLNPAVGTTTTLLTAGSSGQFKNILLSNGNGSLSVQAVDAGTIATIDNLSIKELPGNHAYQTTATARAIYGRVPATGKNNILVNSVMAGGGAVPTGFNQNYATGTSAPYGTINGNTQYRHTANASERPEFTLSAGTLGTTGSITASLFIDEVLSGSPTIVSMIFMAGPAGSTVAYFKNGVAANSTDLVSAGDRISAVLTSGGTSGAASARVGLGAGATIAGDVVFSRPMINVGSTALNYQNSVSDYDTTEDGVQSLVGLKYDGVDDCYVTPSIDFTGTDKVTVWAGVRKLSDEAIAELIGLGNLVSGGFYLLAPSVTGVNSDSLGLSVRGAVTQSTFAKGAAAGSNVVVNACFDLAKTYPESEMKLRYNGVNKTPYSAPTADSGITAFANQPLYIGSRGGISLRFNGWEFGIIVRGAESNDTQITAVEDYLNQHTGAY
jgi:hypothetical protein